MQATANAIQTQSFIAVPTPTTYDLLQVQNLSTSASPGCRDRAHRLGAQTVETYSSWFRRKEVPGGHPAGPGFCEGSLPAADSRLLAEVPTGPFLLAHAKGDG